MPTESPAWSTPKFLLVAFGITFVMMFALNGLLNEILGLGVHGGAFGAASGVVIAMLIPRWGRFREIMQRRRTRS